MLNKTSNVMSTGLSNLLAFDLKHLLSLPCHVYWKDKKSTYLGYNNYGAERLGFKEGEEISGHSDFEIFPESVATCFKKNDQDAMALKKQIFIHEKGVLKNNLKVVFYSYKMPIFNSNRQVLGVLGLSFTRPPENCYPPSQLEKELNYYPATRSGNNSLSTMENACMSHLCRGLTTKQIARQLKISPKTVETYIDRAKIKYNCRNKAELMWAMIQKFSTEQNVH